jgi:protocatechuate 3,4-dioxygenase beta subunit
MNRGVHEDAAVTLTAMTDSMMTTEPASLLLTPDASVELMLRPRHAIKVRGRIVDSQGDPVKGAAVTIRTPQVSQQESYGGEDASAVPLLNLGAAIATDAKGHFVSPPTVDWDRRLSLEIRASDQRTLVQG